MRTRVFAASLVLVFIFALAVSLGLTQTASASDGQCDCVLMYCIDPPGKILLRGKYHEGEFRPCQPNPEHCTLGSCD